MIMTHALVGRVAVRMVGPRSFACPASLMCRRRGRIGVLRGVGGERGGSTRRGRRFTCDVGS